MLTLFVLPLILAFAPAAVWAFKAGGLRRLWLLGAFALLALILAGVGVTRYVRSREAPKPRYQTVTVDRGSIASRVTATGTPKEWK